MMGWSTLPMSPENTICFVTPPSVAVTMMEAEPSRWPASTNSTRTPSHRSMTWWYSQVVMYLATSWASWMV